MAKKVVIPQTKAQLIDALAEKNKLTKVQAKNVYESLLEIVYTGTKKLENGFTLPGLGKLVVTERKRMVRPDPRNPGQTMVCPAKKVVKFRLSKIAQDAIVPPKKKKK